MYVDLQEIFNSCTGTIAVTLAIKTSNPGGTIFELKFIWNSSSNFKGNKILHSSRDLALSN